MKKEYAVYKKDRLLFMGTTEECMRHFGVKRKTVRYVNIEQLEKEELLQHKIIDWFIGSNITDGEIVINVEEE